MTNRSRVAGRRIVLAIPMVMSAVSFALAAAGTAQTSSGTGSISDLPPSSFGQGWFSRTRPAPVECPPDLLACALLGDPIAQNVGLVFAHDHLYVGWDPLAREPEMVAAINFDLFTAGIPIGATVTRFVVTVLEHPNGPSLGNPLEGRNHNHLFPEEAAAQGIVACPWPEFLGGSPAAPIAEAPGEEAGRLCDREVAGVRSGSPANPGAPAEEQVFAWTFDLTPVAGGWAQGTENASFSLEPGDDPATESIKPWITSFHASGIPGPDGRPSVVAAVEWVNPAEPEFGEPEAFPGLELPGAGASAGLPSFGETGGLASELAPPAVAQPAAPRTRRPATVVALPAARRGTPARFWDLPPQAWLAAGIGFALLAVSGWAVLAEPGSARRAPGTVSAMMSSSALRSGRS